MSMILVKMPIRPDRQRVLIGEEGDETDMKLRQWANKKAFAEGLAGEEAAARRDELMREAVGDAGKKHGITFMDDPIPFDEEEPVPVPDEGEKAEDQSIPMEGASHEEATGEAKPKPPASKPLPTGQTTLEDFAPKSFDPHPGDAMLKAIRARLGW